MQTQMQPMPLFEDIEDMPGLPRRRPPSEATRRKANGQFLAERKASSVWQEDSLSLLRRYIDSLRAVTSAPLFTFEGFRVYAELGGHPAPASLNAWGSVPRAACRDRICIWSGQVSSGARAESHGRLLKVWRAL